VEGKKAGEVGDRRLHHARLRVGVGRQPGDKVISAAGWAQLSDWLPEMLAELLASEVYGIDRRPPKDQRGVYLFTDRGKHLYVGRTGITARLRAGGGPVSTVRTAARDARPTTENRGVPSSNLGLAILVFPLRGRSRRARC
jgi:hypothetical protein